MTDSEARDFWKQAFVHFPGDWQWLQQYSPDTSGTLAVWTEALRNVTANEAMSVLVRWSNGTLEPPKEIWEKEIFHLHVLQTVRKDRSERRRRTTQDVDRPVKVVRLRDLIPCFGPYQDDVSAVARSNREPEEIDRILADCYQRACVCVDTRAEYVRNYSN